MLRSPSISSSGKLSSVDSNLEADEVDTGYYFGNSYVHFNCFNTYCLGIFVNRNECFI